MILSLCRGIKANHTKCEGKSSSQTSACLVDIDTKTEFTANNSQIVGSIRKASFALVDGRIYLEFPTNKTCQTAADVSSNTTRRVNTRFEFFCSPKSDIKPTYMGYNNCTYTFEWGTPQICRKNLSSIITDETKKPVEVTQTISFQNKNSTNETAPSQAPKLSDKDMKTDLSELPKSGHELHIDTVSDSRKILDSTKGMANAKSQAVKQTATNNQSEVVADVPKLVKTTPIPPGNISLVADDPSKHSDRMNNMHKFFMIGLIISSLAGFIVVIFILDKKTRLGIPLGSLRRQARQTFQQQPVPYSRVDNINDSLDL